MPRRAWAIPILIFGALMPGSASAHIEIVSHATRYGPDHQKQAPCGLAGSSEPGSEVYTYAPGATIHLAWHEFIDHPGHYRIAFDEQGDDDFLTPSAADDTFNNAAVLLDGIADLEGVHDYEVDVTLPDVECEQCTIQVIQVMTDKPPFGDGNDVYFHCIDVALVAGGDPSGGEPTSSGAEPSGDEPSGDEGGCACTSGSSAPAGATIGVLALLGLLGRPRRERSLVRPRVASLRDRPPAPGG
ncbi:SCE4755 family polysaccharide monooxygenase-like protein [Nannocystaceae bacterium ST9]